MAYWWPILAQIPSRLCWIYNQLMIQASWDFITWSDLFISQWRFENCYLLLVSSFKTNGPFWNMTITITIRLTPSTRWPGDNVRATSFRTCVFGFRLPKLNEFQRRVSTPLNVLWHLNFPNTNLSLRRYCGNSMAMLYWYCACISFQLMDVIGWSIVHKSMKDFSITQFVGYD